MQSSFYLSHLAKMERLLSEISYGVKIYVVKQASLGRCVTEVITPEDIEVEILLTKVYLYTLNPKNVYNTNEFSTAVRQKATDFCTSFFTDNKYRNFLRTVSEIFEVDSETFCYEPGETYFFVSRGDIPLMVTHHQEFCHKCKMLLPISLKDLEGRFCCHNCLSFSDF